MPRQREWVYSARISTGSAGELSSERLAEIRAQATKTLRALRAGQKPKSTSKARSTNSRKKTSINAQPNSTPKPTGSLPKPNRSAKADGQ